MNEWDLEPVLVELMNFRHERDWAQFHRPKELAAALAIEAAELQEEFLWRDPEKATEIKSDSERMLRRRAEAADVAICLLMLVSDLEIPLATAIKDKMSQNAEKYPVGEFRGKFRRQG